MNATIKMGAVALLALAAVAQAQTTVTRTETEVRSQGPGAVRLVELPTDSLVRIRMLDTIDSKNWKEGDRFPYEVAQDVIVDGEVAIPAGTKGAGVITEARHAGSFGKSGKIEMSFGALPVGGTNVDLVLSDKARQGNEKEHLAAGASLAGLAVAGPIGLVGGLFIHGHNVKVEAGSELFVATTGRAQFEPRVHRVIER